MFAAKHIYLLVFLYHYHVHSNHLLLLYNQIKLVIGIESHTSINVFFYCQYQHFETHYHNKSMQ